MREIEKERKSLFGTHSRLYRSESKSFSFELPLSSLKPLHEEENLTLSGFSFSHSLIMDKIILASCALQV